MRPTISHVFIAALLALLVGGASGRCENSRGEKRLSLHPRWLLDRSLDASGKVLGLQKGRASADGRDSLQRDRIGSAELDEALLTPDKVRVGLVAESNQIAQYQWNEDFGLNRSGDPDREHSVAQKVFVFQGLQTLSQYVLTTPLGNTYRKAISAFRKVEPYTKASVQRTADGGMDLTYGSGKKGKRLFDLRLQTSTQNGVEPEVQLFDDFQLKYNTVEHGPMLQWQFQF